MIFYQFQFCAGLEKNYIINFFNETNILFFRIRYFTISCGFQKIWNLGLWRCKESTKTVDQVLPIVKTKYALTSLSLKCVLSFSCSGVKCNIFSSPELWFFNTYLWISKFSQQIKISTAPSSNAFNVSSTPKQYFPVSWLISSK